MMKDVKRSEGYLRWDQEIHIVEYHQVVLDGLRLPTVTSLVSAEKATDSSMWEVKVLSDSVLAAAALGERTAQPRWTHPPQRRQLLQWLMSSSTSLLPRCRLLNKDELPIPHEKIEAK